MMLAVPEDLARRQTDLLHGHQSGHPTARPEKQLEQPGPQISWLSPRFFGKTQARWPREIMNRLNAHHAQAAGAVALRHDRLAAAAEDAGPDKQPRRVRRVPHSTQLAFCAAQSDVINSEGRRQRSPLGRVSVALLYGRA